MTTTFEPAVFAAPVPPPPPPPVKKGKGKLIAVIAAAVTLAGVGVGVGAAVSGGDAATTRDRVQDLPSSSCFAECRTATTVYVPPTTVYVAPVYVPRTTVYVPPVRATRRYTDSEIAQAIISAWSASTYSTQISVCQLYNRAPSVALDTLASADVYGFDADRVVAYSLWTTWLDSKC